MPAFLIGQLAKNDFFKNELKGSELINQALAIIRMAQEHVGGRVVVADCKSELKLKQFYLDNGFKFLGHNNRNDLDQFVFKLN